MKKLMVVVLMIVTLMSLAGVASAEHGNIGGIGVSSIRTMEHGNIGTVGIR